MALRTPTPSQAALEEMAILDALFSTDGVYIHRHKLELEAECPVYFAEILKQLVKDGIVQQWETPTGTLKYRIAR